MMLTADLIGNIQVLLFGSGVAAAMQIARLMTRKEPVSLRVGFGSVLGAFIAHFSFTSIISEFVTVAPLAIIGLGGLVGFQGAEIMEKLSEKLWSKYA